MLELERCIGKIPPDEVGLDPKIVLPWIKTEG
jgi:hypothetical protein